MNDEVDTNDSQVENTSFRSLKFESETMKYFLQLEETDHDKLGKVVEYSTEKLFPCWIVNDPEWKLTASRHKENEISLIMRVPVQQRTQEQVSTLVHWLMSVWETARLMGFKRCAAMSKVFQVFTYEPEENIITEGERGLTFFIIISGTCGVHKNGIGKVATISKGQSFGELALTEGKDVRTATIRTESIVEVLRLHKADYDYFVKDIQLAERRENLLILQNCRAFGNVGKVKIRKMVTICKRKIFEAESYIFRQGDVPDMLYIIIDGQVAISKEIHYSIRNRWPVSMSEWECVTRRQIKPYVISVLTKGSCFGVESILLNQERRSTAQAKTMCTLLCVDRLEFLHLLDGGFPIIHEAYQGTRRSFPYVLVVVGLTVCTDDAEILDKMAELRGGPSTTAQLNGYILTTNISSNSSSPSSNKLQKRKNKSRSRNIRLVNTNRHNSDSSEDTSSTSSPQPLLEESFTKARKDKSSAQADERMEKFRHQLSVTLKSSEHLFVEEFNSPIRSTKMPSAPKGCIMNSTKNRRWDNEALEETVSDSLSGGGGGCSDDDDNDDNDDASGSFSELTLSSNSVTFPRLQARKQDSPHRRQSLRFNLTSPPTQLLSPIHFISEKVEIKERIGLPKKKSSILSPIKTSFKPSLNFS